MQTHTTPAALVGIEEVATALGIAPDAARIYLQIQNDAPVAIYKGRELWLSDTLHDVLDRDPVTNDPVPL